MQISLIELRETLAQHQPQVSPFDPAANNASVALILRGDGPAMEACFIRRAEREGDHWSGHMALPGGRTASTDPTARAVAEREVAEEIGVFLQDEHFVGRLSDLPIRSSGEPAGHVSPFVFCLGPDRPSLRCSEEVDEVHWVSLPHLWSSQNHVIEPQPAILVERRRIWGLTLRILRDFARSIGHPLPL